MHRLSFRALLVVALVVAGAPGIARVPHHGTVVKKVRIRSGQAALPIVLGVWAQGGDVNDPDPGAIADQHLFAGINDNSPLVNGTGVTLETNCPGEGASGNISGCIPVHYMNVLHLLCTFSVTFAAYQWANANDEDAFLHKYPGTRASGNRDTFTNATGDHCAPPNGNGNAYFMNPGDAAYNNYLANNVWNNPGVAPGPYAVLADVMGLGYPAEGTTEYGKSILNKPGTGKYNVGYDWETAHGNFVNGACPPGGTICVPMIINALAPGDGSTPGPCANIVASHCYAAGGAGIIDDQDAIDNLCSSVTGNNLVAMEFEEVTHLKLGNIPGPSWLAYAVNTMANLVSHTSDGCQNTVAIDIEFSSGNLFCNCGYPANGGCGDIAGGIAWRTEALAWRWLVPNVDSIPDKVQAKHLTIGGTAQEVPYFFEDTLVPTGAEEPTSKFVWNGSTVTEGDGCPSSAGDTGGAIGIMVQCINPGAILCQQYQHLFINLIDYGAAAACLNTSAGTTENIVGSWFVHDPISTYKYRLALSGGELQSVPYANCCGGTISIPACSSATYCTGSTNLAAQTTAFAGDGSDALAGNSGVILLANNAPATPSPTPSPTPPPTPTPSPTPTPTPPPSPTPPPTPPTSPTPPPDYREHVMQPSSRLCDYEQFPRWSVDYVNSLGCSAIAGSHAWYRDRVQLWFTAFVATDLRVTARSDAEDGSPAVRAAVFRRAVKNPVHVN